jgi:hypothetical protein
VKCEWRDSIGLEARVGYASDSRLEMDVTRTEGIEWTNTSVVQLAQGDNPVAVIERRARELVLRARDAGWQGPPFNPVAIADLLNIPVEANADVADARTVSTDDGVKIEFNPTQARERVRFSKRSVWQDCDWMQPSANMKPRATQDRSRQRALVVADKADRVFNFHRATIEALAELVGAAGLDHPIEFASAHFSRRISAHQVRSFAELYPPLEPGTLLAGRGDKHFEISRAIASAKEFRALPRAAGMARWS